MFRSGTDPEKAAAEIVKACLAQAVQWVAGRADHPALATLTLPE